MNTHQIAVDVILIDNVGPVTVSTAWLNDDYRHETVVMFRHNGKAHHKCVCVAAGTNDAVKAHIENTCYPILATIVHSVIEGR